MSLISNIQHTYLHIGGSFQARIYLKPTDVSFDRIEFGEGTAVAVANGFWAPINGSIHEATSPSVSVGNCHLINGCRMSGVDTVGNWSNSPVTPPVPPGSFSWDIPWYYYSNNTTGFVVNALHYTTTNSNGDSTLSKLNAGPYPVNRTDPTSSY